MSGNIALCSEKEGDFCFFLAEGSKKGGNGKGRLLVYLLWEYENTASHRKRSMQRGTELLHAGPGESRDIRQISKNDRADLEINRGGKRSPPAPEESSTPLGKRSFLMSLGGGKSMAEFTRSWCSGALKRETVQIVQRKYSTSGRTLA